MVTRYADIAEVFRDVETYSAAAAQLPLVALEPEATIAVQRLAARFPQLSLPAQDIPFHPNISFRGPQRLLVETGVSASQPAER